MINGMIFYFEIVNFPFLDGDVPRSTSHGVYVLMLATLTIETNLYKKRLSIP